MNRDQVTYETYSHSDLIRDLASDQFRRDSGSLQVVGKEVYERIDGDVRGAIASIDANSFIDLICTQDRQTIKRYLFDDNLRIYLGSSGGFNSSIISTATSEDNYLFWYLNNGITITCKNYSYNKWHSNPKIILENFQIVNGAQTSHSLIEASRHNPESIENVVLLVRIYATDRSDIVERVAVATNSQAKIQLRDLKSNHVVLKKLEMAFLEKGHFFERKRNMHAEKPIEKRIDALKLGQIIMTFYLRDPDRARAASDSIFDERFSQIFSESNKVDDLCLLFELYSNLEELRDRYSSRSGGREKPDDDYTYLIYGHWHIFYACALIIADRKIAIPAGSAPDNLIAESVSVVARACREKDAVSHYQLFRSPKTKVKIYQEVFGPQPSLFDFLEQIK